MHTITKIKKPFLPKEFNKENFLADKNFEKNRLTLIGEASHGTSEYYVIRTQITKMLIEKYNYNFIAVEGDWPDCFKLNKYVKGKSEHDNALSVLRTFKRWPTWMWANWEVVAFIDWLKTYNEDKDEKEKVGFYGMDLYSLNQSMELIVDYLENNDPEQVEKAKTAYECFQPSGGEGFEYAMSIRLFGKDCENEVLELLTDMLDKNYKENQLENELNIKQNTLVVKNAEDYYRNLATGGKNTWNIRDSHMMETVKTLLKDHGEDSKGVLWAHNTHVGDSRATDMSDRGLYNIGELARKEFPDETFIIGFGGYKGSVIAAEEWGAPMQEFTLPEAPSNSWEGDLESRFDQDNFLIGESLRDEYFKEWKGHRAVGVVYNPQYERFGNYVPTSLGNRYDAFIKLKDTSALSPILEKSEQRDAPKLFPWGF